MLAGPLESLRKQASTLQRSTAGIGRIAELFRKQPAVRSSGQGHQALPPGALSVHFDDVSFAYLQYELPDSKAHEDPEEDQNAGLVLREVSFSLAAGRVLGVLGRTGSGKTTLTRLLFRLYDPSEGAVKLGGADI